MVDKDLINQETHLAPEVQQVHLNGNSSVGSSITTANTVNTENRKNSKMELTMENINDLLNNKMILDLQHKQLTNTSITSIGRKNKLVNNYKDKEGKDLKSQKQNPAPRCHLLITTRQLIIVMTRYLHLPENSDIG